MASNRNPRWRYYAMMRRREKEKTPVTPKPLMVRFKLDLETLAKRSGNYGCSPCNAHGLLGSAAAILNLNDEQFRLLRSSGVAWVICSPQRFVEWQVWRNSAGITNTFRELEVTMVSRVPEPVIPTICTEG